MRANSRVERERNRAIHLCPPPRPQPLTIPTLAPRPEQPPHGRGWSLSPANIRSSIHSLRRVCVRATQRGGGGAKLGHREARGFPSTNVVMSLRVQLSSQQRSTLRQLACSLLPVCAPETSPRTTSHLWPLLGGREPARSDPNTKTTVCRGKVSAVCHEHMSGSRPFPSRGQALASLVTAPAPKDTQQGPVPPKKHLAGTSQGRQVSPITSRSRLKPVTTGGECTRTADTWDGGHLP